MKPEVALSVLLVGVMIICARASGESLNDIAGRIPNEFDGWRADGRWRYYDRKTLFQHIDGGAELYLAYRFKGAIVRRYLKGKEMEIALDIYDMGTPDDAFGVFSVERLGEDVGIGQGSDYIEGLLRFWKGRFFVSILTRLETDETKSAVMKLGGIVANAISETGKLTKLISILPTEGLKERSVCFLRTHTILNRIYFLADKNILELGDNTECVMGRYEQGNKSAYLLLIRYSDARGASKALNRFITSYIPEAKRSKVAKLEDGKYVASDSYGRFLLIALDATTKEFALKLIEATRQRLKEVKM